MSAEAKRQQLEERKNRWMADRQATLSMSVNGGGGRDSRDSSQQLQVQAQSQPLQRQPKAAASSQPNSNSAKFVLTKPKSSAPSSHSNHNNSSNSNSNRASGGGSNEHRYKQYNEYDRTNANDGFGRLAAPPSVPSAAAPSSSSSYNRAGGDSGGNNNEEFIDKLTQKLARNIREEVQRELSMTTHSVDVRDAISEHMSSYLAAELGTHTCKICSQLMVSPNHTPILLFPCGHTFCQAWYTNLY
jgi:hypothetical protein